MNPIIESVTNRIIRRSARTRGDYLARMHAAAGDGPARSGHACSNLAHGFAACGADEKQALKGAVVPNIGIVSAYNDMLSAHQPFETYPAIIRDAAAEHGAVAQFAGGVPAMCDGVTQGTDGMDLSLFSRDVIALSTAVALSHNMFDAVLCLGICDKIVPGLLIGALSFGHLPVVFVPAGPMVSGLGNKEKARIREEYAAGRIGRDELLEAESAAYHAPGTCTFYGTANSNQMLMEFMGLQLPGGSFVNPGTEMREHLTRAAVGTVLTATNLGNDYRPLAELLDEKAIVNGIIGLLATGGSTNHTIHLAAIASAAGIQIDWQDFSELSGAVPQLSRVYPNGTADVNHFHAAGVVSVLPAVFGYWAATKALWLIGVVGVGLLLTVALVRRQHPDLSNVRPITMRLADDFFVTSNELVNTRHDWSCIVRTEQTPDHLLLFTDRLHVFIIAKTSFESGRIADEFFNFAKRKSVAASKPTAGDRPRWKLTEPELVTIQSDDIIRAHTTLSMEQVMQLDFHGLNPPTQTSATSSLIYFAIMLGVSLLTFLGSDQAGRVLLCLTFGVLSIALATSVYGHIKRWRWRVNLNPRRLEPAQIAISQRGLSHCSASTEGFAKWQYYSQLNRNDEFLVLQPAEPLCEGAAIDVSDFRSRAEADAFAQLASECLQNATQTVTAQEVSRPAETGNPYQPPLEDA